MNRTLVPALVVFAMFATSAPVARAADEADEAQFHFTRGNYFYGHSRFEEALQAYYASNRLVPNRNVRFNIARCLEQLRLYHEAFRAWSALDVSNAQEGERAVIRESLESLRAHLALVQVTTDPPGATIYAARRDLGALGSSPKLLPLPEGKAKLLLDLAGYRSIELQVDLVKGKEARATAKLERIYGMVELRRLPPEAEVRRDFVDGALVRRGPGPARFVPARQVLFVSAPGFQTERLEVEVKPDTTVPVDVPLSAVAPPAGAVVVRANFDGALVRIDGKEMGFTPTVIEGIPEGERIVEVSKEGRQSSIARVQVKRGERAYLDLSLRRAEREVTAATKSLVRAEDAPASITVITADEIAAFGYATLADALAGVRGAFSSNDRSYQSVGFRGFSPPGDYTSRVLVLVDGHPYNEVVLGQGYVGHDLDVDLSNVERIEVVRGPGSVLYGTAALFGVINVVTKRPAAGHHGAVLGHGGSLGAYSGRATASERGESWELAVTAAYLHQLGDRRYELDDRTSVGEGDVERVRHADVRGRVGPVTVRAAWNERDKTIPTGVFETRAEPGTMYRDTRAYAEVRLDQPLGPVRLSGRAAYDSSRFGGVYKLTPDEAGLAREDLADSFKAQWVTGELRLELPSFAGNRLTLGGEAQSQFQIDLGDPSIEAQRAGNGDRELILSAYLVDDWQLSRRLRLNVGVRADDYRNSFGATLNPRLAVIARPYLGGNTKLLLGRSFRAPSTYERFYNDGGETQIQAGALAPETIRSAELEHAHVVDDDVTLVGTIFANEVDNLIELSATKDTSTKDVLAYQNHAAKVRGLGAEGELRWEPGAGNLLAISYSWQRVRSYEDGQSSPYPNAPEHLVSLRLLHPLVSGLVRIGSELQYDAGRHTRQGARVDDAVICNLTASGEYRRWGLTYFAGLFNLLDVRGYGSGYPVGDEVRTVTVPRYGRSARVGLQLAF